MSYREKRENEEKRGKKVGSKALLMVNAIY
jgi:hypothetical protein